MCERETDRAPHTGNGRFVCKYVQGVQRVLDKKTIREVKWDGPEAKESRGARVNPEEAGLADQDLTEAGVHQKSAIAEEVVGLAEGRVRETDAWICKLEGVQPCRLYKRPCRVW